MGAALFLYSPTLKETAMPEIKLTRNELGEYTAHNERGGSITVGSGGTEDFGPVELLLVALAGCSGVDVDYITSKRAEPTEFTATASGTKVKDENGNHLTDVVVTFDVRFPEGEAGDKARAMLPKAITMSHERLCTVSRTIALGTPVEMRAAE